MELKFKYFDYICLLCSLPLQYPGSFLPAAPQALTSAYTAASAEIRLRWILMGFSFRTPEEYYALTEMLYGYF